MKKIFYKILVIILSMSFLSGCASIVSKSNWPVSIQTNPTGANCLISKESEAPLHTGTTPISLNLDSSAGFFQPAKYKIKCTKEGYQNGSSEFSANLNGWYIGNILVGGLIGWLIVDPATGAMWKLDETVIINLAEDKSISAIDRTRNKVPEKTTESSMEAKTNYEAIKGLKGIELMNGHIIEGQVVSISADIVKIRTKDGTVSSYSFVEDVKGFITK